MMKARILVALTALLVLPALADAGDEYKLDTSHSMIGFGVKHMAVTTVRGSFGEYEGMAVIDLDDLANSKVEVSIQTASVDTRNGRRDDHLRSDDFFDAENHPEMTFVSTAIEQEGDDLVVVGDLTIRGTTKSVRMPVEVAGPIQDPWGNSRMGVSGSVTIDRTEFGLNYSNVLETGGLVVAKDVVIQIDAELIAAKEEE